MSIKSIISALISLLVVSIILMLTSPAFAQRNVTLELVNRSSNPQREFLENIKKERKAILWTPSGNIAGFMFWNDGNVTLELPSGTTFDVAPYLGTIISEDGNTIVQMGQPGCEELCTSYDLFFYTRSGQLHTHIGGVYSAAIRSAISDDGHLVIAGFQREPPRAVLTMYSPHGEELWTDMLGSISQIRTIRISPSASYIALAYERLPAYSLDDDIVLYNRDGTRVLTQENIRAVDRFMFLGQEEYLAITSFGKFQVVDVSSETPHVMWGSPKQYNLVDQQAIRVFEQQQLLVLVIAERPQISQYVREVCVLDLHTGEELVAMRLPGHYYTAHCSVQGSENPDKFSVVTDNDIYSFQLTSYE